ncbi:hypothetical protein BDK51DRAFT_29658 [Blyttiomyces helicus]|uniref:Uncharacterized protein n=1 Tax=Blyttiomyces helicus TaxID=388810 RepID=A0A4P9WNV3_9FUNG|nr:hypothetical protein BDK51DRAFT_29658 [Blyttiomyces helicus]|eukprot:RKO93783.1 hypothetical protein BDK51DRAFT_29658 [Blyttiomyces helicus]
MNSDTHSFNVETSGSRQQTKYDEQLRSPTYDSVSTLRSHSPGSPSPFPSFTAASPNHDELVNFFYGITANIAARFQQHDQAAIKLYEYIQTQNNELQTHIDHIDKKIRADDYHETVQKDILRIDNLCQSVNRRQIQTHRHIRTINNRLSDLRDDIRKIKEQGEARNVSIKRSFDLVDYHQDDIWKIVNSHHTETARIDALSQLEALKNNRQTAVKHSTSTPLNDILIDIYGLPAAVDLDWLTTVVSPSRRSTRMKIDLMKALASADYFLPNHKTYNLDSGILIVKDGINQFTNQLCIKYPCIFIGDVVYKALAA